MIEEIKDMFSETWQAITADQDREIGILILPLLITIIVTGMQFAIMTNPGQTVILTQIKNSGVCNTNQPYLVTSVGGTFEHNPMAHVALCQVVDFNILVFLAWLGQIYLITLLGIFIFEMITHYG